MIKITGRISKQDLIESIEEWQKYFILREDTPVHYSGADNLFTIIKLWLKDKDNI